MSNGMFTDDGGISTKTPETLTLENLMRMLGGIGQAELGAIWLDPTIEEIIQRNSIRMNPEAPYDIAQAQGITPEAVSELSTVIQEIEDAGGYDEWLTQQDLEGPPEELPTELEEEVDINADTTLEDEIGVDPDMPIDIPPPTLPPREEEEGDGEGDGDGDGVGENGTGQETAGEIPDYSDMGDPDYGYPGGLPRQGSGGVIDDYRPTDPGFTVGIGVPFLGGGGGGGEGGGGGGTAPQQGMFKDKFTPFMTSIGYTPVQLQQLIAPPKKDYIRELAGS
jgi:hypothetical protein